MKYQEKLIGEPVFITILPEDMKESVYDSITFCPLAKACKRHFGMGVAVSSVFVVGYGPTANFQFKINDGKGFMEEEYNGMLLNLTQDPKYTHQVKLQQYVNTLVED